MECKYSVVVGKYALPAVSHYFSPISLEFGVIPV